MLLNFSVCFTSDDEVVTRTSAHETIKSNVLEVEFFCGVSDYYTQRNRYIDEILLIVSFVY